MPIAKQEDVQAILLDFEDRIRGVVDRAWREWQEFPDKGRFVFQARVRAVVVFDFIARIAQQEFDGDPNIRALITSQTIKFLFKNRVLVRFKKGNANGVGSNIQTQAVLDFIDPQRTIPGLVPDVMKVEVSYRPDDLGISLGEVAVVHRDRRKRLWSYALERGAPDAAVVPLPLRPGDATPPTVVPRQPSAEEDADNSK